MVVDRDHIYRVYRDGRYLGTLPNVTSYFSYTQDINTAGAQTEIEVDLSLDTSSEPPEVLQDEAGNTLQLESGEPITLERSLEIIGAKDSGLLIANGNDVLVYEVSDDDINGALVFSGYISNWVHDTQEQEKVTITVISAGKDLDDYIFGNESFALEVSQTSTGNDFGFWATRRYGQTFTTGAAQTDLPKIILIMAAGSAGSRTITLRMWNNTAAANIGATDLGSATVAVSNTSFAEVSFIFASPITVLPATSYFFTVEVDAGSVVGDGTTWAGFDAGAEDSYANGDLYRSLSGAAWTNEPGDFYFKVYSGTLLTDATFAATDPSTMVTDALDGYNSQGGVVTYTGSSIDLTGYSVDYTFKLATVLEIIRQAKDFAPGNFYWYVDPATQILYFKETLTTATHKMILGRHLESVAIESTIEEIKNVVYFTGGPTAGVNLLKKYSDVSSLAVNKLGMERINNNRIVAANEDSARILSENFMSENSDEIFRSRIVISASTYDIRSFNIGDTVGFGGWGNFVDSLILQITRKEPQRNSVALTLGKLPLRSDGYVDSIKRDLEKEQTLDNPNTPS